MKKVLIIAFLLSLLPSFVFARTIILLQKHLFNDANLVGYWRFESNLLDSKNSNNLTSHGSPSYIAGQPGFGNDQNMVAPNTTQYSTATSTMGIQQGAMSLVVWVNDYTQPTSTSYFGWIQKQSSSTCVQEDIFYYNNSGSLQIRYDRSAASAANVFDTVTLATGTWHQVALTYDNATLTGFLDGVSVGSTAATGTTTCTPSTNNFGIGATVDNTAALFANAQEDDASLWSRALTPAEVSELYTQRSLEGNGISR